MSTWRDPRPKDDPNLLHATARHSGQFWWWNPKKSRAACNGNLIAK
jgi:hypothetical protein